MIAQQALHSLRSDGAQLAERAFGGSFDVWQSRQGRHANIRQSCRELCHRTRRARAQQKQQDQMCRSHGRKPDGQSYHSHESMRSHPEKIGEQIVELLPRLRRFARALSRNQHDADDLVQSAVERAWRHLDQLRSDAPLASWLFGIMKNAWIDGRRARDRRHEVTLPDDSGSHPAVDPTEVEGGLRAVSEALARLPDDQRLAVALVLVEGLSYKEAAQSLDIPIGTLTSRLARGRAALATALGGDDAI